ncbi:MAG TPA: DUF3500 domain-containing protein [Mycobacteriales bacterium]|nr:DUF3500 domain-containing protein [Mycobacteriales bacterium]
MSALPAVSELATRMGTAAADWLGVLRADQLDRAQYPFDDPQRREWFYTPNIQAGLTLADMTATQQRATHRLVANALSDRGYAVLAAVMGLENLIDAEEGWTGSYSGLPPDSRRRDPQLYFLAVFGDPAGPVWGWRFGGHHVSINYTIVEGRIAAGPIFLGARPAVTVTGANSTLRPLANEADLAEQLVRSLDADQRADAIVAPEAPADILQTNRASVPTGRWTPPGLAAKAMTDPQRAVLSGLVRQYAERLPAALAEDVLARVADPASAEAYFAWAGDPADQAHYYRVQADRLLIEYDNVQDGANHAHSVWRDPTLDFGGDLLR